MKKPSLKIDSAKLKNAFIQHVEKIVLGIVLLVVIGFVYAGYSLPTLDGNVKPKDLRDLGDMTTQAINKPENWQNIADDPVRTVQSGKLEQQLHKAVAPNDHTAYGLVMPWKKPDFPRLSLRTDPKLLPPINLKVVPMYGPVAYMRTQGDTDPLGMDLGTGAGMMAGMDAGMMIPPDAAAAPAAVPVPGGSRTNRNRNRRQNRNPMMDAAMAPPAEDPTMMLQPGADMAMEPQTITISKPYYPEAVRGYRPNMSAVAKPVQAMVIMAVVPFEKQIEEYEKALAESLDYDPLRDAPRYLQFYVQRADVTDDPSAEPTEEQWDRVSTNASLRETFRWAGYPQEILDPNYLDPVGSAPTSPQGAGAGEAMMIPGAMPGMGVTASTTFGVLTHPAPPFMLRDLWEILTHPDVPKMQTRSAMTTPQQNPALPSEEGPISDRPGTDFPGSIRRPQMAMGMGMEGFAPSPDMIMPGMEGMAGSGTQVASRPKYKLIRFTDLTVEPGKVYRYRLAVLLEDPNNPKNFTAPSIPSLEGTVLDRVRKQQADDAKSGNQVYWVNSEWSAASDPVRLPDTSSYLAASVTQPAAAKIVQGRPPILSNQLKASAVTVTWDPSKAADLAVEKEIYRGSHLSFTADAQTLHPTLLQFTTIENAEFRTGAIVADMEGGEAIAPLKRTSDKPLTTPAELLIFDAEGNLHVQNELEDIEEIRKFTKPPDETIEQPAPAGFDPMMDPMGGFMEEPIIPGRRRGR